MCVMRHSAARPNRLPLVCIKHARRRPFSTDWSIGSAAKVDAQGTDVTDAYIPAAVANDNQGFRRLGVWRIFTRYFLFGIRRTMPS